MLKLTSSQSASLSPWIAEKETRGDNLFIAMQFSLFFRTKKFNFWRQVTKIVNKIFHAKDREGEKAVFALEKFPTDKTFLVSFVSGGGGGWVVTVPIVQPNDLALCFLDLMINFFCHLSLTNCFHMEKKVFFLLKVNQILTERSNKFLFRYKKNLGW